MAAVTQLAPTVGIRSACDALGVARASFYRQQRLDLWALRIGERDKKGSRRGA